MRGGIVATVCGAALAVLAAGCAQSVPGTAYAEGEGPTAASVEAGDGPASGIEPGTSSPPSSFTVPGPLPSGRPTVTVQPEPEAGPSAPAAPTIRYPMPFDDPPPGLTTPVPAAPGTGPRAVPDAPGGSTRTVPPRRSRTTTASPRPDRPATAPRPRAEEPAPPRSAAPGPLTSDVVPDECLLDGAGFRALLGAAVPAPTNHVVTRPDGSRTRSCFATASGSPAPTAAVNVYQVNTGTPVAFLRAATGARPLPGVGEGAVLVDTVAGPTVQIATPRLLITIAVANHTPSETTWREAARATVAALPRR